MTNRGLGPGTPRGVDGGEAAVYPGERCSRDSSGPGAAQRVPRVRGARALCGSCSRGVALNGSVRPSARSIRSTTRAPIGDQSPVAPRDWSVACCPDRADGPGRGPNDGANTGRPAGPVPRSLGRPQVPSRHTARARSSRIRTCPVTTSRGGCPMPRGMADLLDQPAREHGFRLAEAPDVACGVGRHAVALAERGVDICGADLSPAVPEGIYRRVAVAASS